MVMTERLPTQRKEEGPGACFRPVELYDLGFIVGLWNKSPGPPCASIQLCSTDPVDGFVELYSSFPLWVDGTIRAGASSFAETALLRAASPAWLFLAERSLTPRAEPTLRAWLPAVRQGRSHLALLGPAHSGGCTWRLQGGGRVRNSESENLRHKSENGPGRVRESRP